MLHERIIQLEQAQHLAQAQLDQAHTAQQHNHGHPAIIPVKEPRISSPPHFSGKKEEAMEFLLKCDMVFAVQPQSYATTEAKLAFVINLLKDEAYRWVMPHLTMDDNIKPDWIKDWTLFREEFKKVFGDSEIIETARHKLKTLKQTGPATSYATEFRRYAAYLHYSDEALRHLFFDGLKEDVKDKILTPNNAHSIDILVDTAIKWDNLLFQRRRTYSTQSRPVATTRVDNIFTRPRPINNVFRPTIMPSSSPAQSTHTPMEIDAVRPRFAPLTQEEKDHRRKNNLCMYCGKAGHIANDCKAKINPAKPRYTPKINASSVNTSESKNSQPQA